MFLPPPLLLLFRLINEARTAFRQNLFNEETDETFASYSTDMFTNRQPEEVLGGQVQLQPTYQHPSCTACV